MTPSSSRSRLSAAHPRAFTLVELLVVIAVIAMLIGILMPALGAARRSGRSSACLSNVKLLALSSNMYATDFKVFVGFSSGNDRKQALLYYTNSGLSNADTSQRQLWNCPEQRATNIGFEAGYGFNTKLNWKRLADVRDPSNTVNLADGGINDDGTMRAATHLMPPSTPTTASLCRPNPRHQGGANAGFTDGHAAWLAIAPPFYPGVAGVWTGNGITDPADAQYVDQMWDLF